MTDSAAFAALHAENARLIVLLESHGIEWRQPQPQPLSVVRARPGSPGNQFSTEEKVALFRRPFRGRTDVYPMRTKHRERWGSVLATWVVAELRKNMALNGDPWYLAHYRDKDQLEVDFVLKSPLREVIGIEVKAAATVSAADFKGLRRLKEHTGKDFIADIVLYGGVSAARLTVRSAEIHNSPQHFTLIP